MGWPNNLDIIFLKIRYLQHASVYMKHVKNVLQSCQNVFSLEMSWNIIKLNFDPSFIILLLFVVVVVRKKYNCAYLEVLIGLYFVINASVLNYFVYLMRILPFMMFKWRNDGYVSLLTCTFSFISVGRLRMRRNTVTFCYKNTSMQGSVIISHRFWFFLTIFDFHVIV